MISAASLLAISIGYSPIFTRPLTALANSSGACAPGAGVTVTVYGSTTCYTTPGAVGSFCGGNDKISVASDSETGSLQGVDFVGGGEALGTDDGSISIYNDSNGVCHVDLT